MKKIREQLIVEYHRALAADEDLTSEFFGRLKEMMRAELYLDGR